MLRVATTRLLSHRRPFSTTASSDELFMAAWKRAIPNLDPPKTPLSFMYPRQAAIPSKLTINLVDMVIVPATTGQMGILPGYITSIAELKPGLLSIHEGNEVTKYFISNGFVFVHSNSITDIIACEAVPIEQIDPSCVQKGLAEFTQKLSKASTDVETAEAQIGVDVLSALNSALSG